jgi:hypothetical protein
LPVKKWGLGWATGNWEPGTPLKAGVGLMSEARCLNHRRASIFLDLSKIFLSYILLMFNPWKFYWEMINYPELQAMS